MRRVARQATFVGLDRSMFEDERTHGVSVALGADRELTGSGAHLMADLCAVRIMAIAALYESNIDAMTIGPGEFSLLRGMTSIAQGSLRLDQQEIDIAGTVRAVTVRAADAVRQVFGLGKVLRFQAGLVASRANRCSGGRTQLLKANDLGDVSAAVNVGLRRAVTSLASMLIAFEQRGMRSIRKVFVPDFLVAGLANVCVGVLAAGRAGKRSRSLRSCFARLLLFFRRCRSNHATAQEECQHE